jgi:hypothetical protein
MAECTLRALRCRMVCPPLYRSGLGLPVDVGDVLWSRLVIYVLVVYFTMLFRVMFDVFRDQTLSGVAKAGRLSSSWSSRRSHWLSTSSSAAPATSVTGGTSARIRRRTTTTSVMFAGSRDNVTEQIARAHKLLSSGALSHQEFDALKAQALIRHLFALTRHLSPPCDRCSATFAGCPTGSHRVSPALGEDACAKLARP